MKSICAWMVIFSGIVFAQGASAFPINQILNPFDEITENLIKTVEGDPLFTQDYNFKGIVSLWGCSASLVRFEQSRGSDQAMVLSNGHCLRRFPAPGTHIFKKRDSRSFTVLDARANRIGRINSKQILYATMTGTDMSLFVLKETFAEIENQHGIKALTLASQKANVSDSIEIISGYWRRGYSCQVEKFVHKLKEDRWTMNDSIRYSRPGCNTVGGTSGSPIILAGTRTVIGVNNTGNESGRRCTMNNPCEVDKNGNVTANRGYSYGQQTYWIYSCLNEQMQLDLNRPGCQLSH